MTTPLVLDIGGTKVRWGIVEAGDTYEVTQRGSIPIDAMRGGVDVAARICDLASSLVASHPQVAGVAVASADVVDPLTGDIVSVTGTMPGWGSTPLGVLSQEATGPKVRVFNDVHAHGLGEATFGVGQPYCTVLSIAVGTGIGGALVEDHQTSFGSRGIAGHAGHIHHHFVPDIVCSCGRKGHIESFCPGSGITAWYDSLHSESDPEVDDGRAPQELAQSGNALVAACFSRSAFALGEATASLANCVDPAVVILSGSMTCFGDIWWDALREGFAASAMTPVADTSTLVGSLSGDAPLLGAVSFFLHAQEFTMHLLIANLKGKLIVSVQACPGEPMRYPEAMAQIARAAEIGGAAVIRCQGLSDISTIKGRVDVSVIGLWKEGHEDVYITPLLCHARAYVMAGSDIVALDATGRPRLNGLSFAETVAALREDGTPVMADCGSFEDAQYAVGAGVDIVSTTLVGYMDDRVKTDGPDLELLCEVVAAFPDVPVICEGRVHTPEQAAAAMETGVFAVVVSTAITHPASITAWFKTAVGD